MRQILLAIALLILLTMSVCSAQPPTPELRGVWLTNVDSDVLQSREHIAEAMQFLAEHHFNAVFPVVWNDGFTLYPSAIMDSLFGQSIDPAYENRDPLAEVIEEAHKWGLAVVPWFEFGFSSSYKQNGGHILRTKPDWAARDRDGKLLSKNGFEWMNPYHPEVQRFLSGLILEVVGKYDIKGVQGDDRLPGQPVEGGYEAYTDSLYRAQHQGKSSPRDPRDPDWMRWRADILNDFAKTLYKNIKKIKPEVMVSWAPNIYPWCYEEYLQDWPGWIQGGYADQLIPQVYRYDAGKYSATLQGVQEEIKRLARPGSGVFPGILIKLGDYLIEPAYLLKAIQHNREQGFKGEVFFFYEGLRKENDKLARILLQGPYRNPAVLPF